MIIWLITLWYEKRRAQKARRRAFEQLAGVAPVAGSPDNTSAGPANFRGKDEDVEYSSESTTLYSVASAKGKEGRRKNDENDKQKSNTTNQKSIALTRNKDVLVLDVKITDPRLVLIGEDEGGTYPMFDRHDQTVFFNEGGNHQDQQTHAHTQQWMREEGW